ncbi:MAG: hypothetical protein SGBAC_003786 [Bacillariaceae sp.]
MSTPSFEENPFQRLSAGGAISRAFSLLFERKEVFLPIGALCYIPIVAVAATMLHLTGSAVATASQEAANQEEADTEVADYSSYFGAQQDFHAGSFLGQLLVEFVLLDIVIILAKGAIVYAVASMYTQQKPNLGSSLKQGWSRCLESVVYFSIRVEKEGMNLEVLEREMGFVEISTDLSKEVV